MEYILLLLKNGLIKMDATIARSAEGILKMLQRSEPPICNKM